MSLFPAARAGIKRGNLIKKINDVEVKHILDETAAKQLSHSNERVKINNMCDEIVGLCFGNSGDTIIIAYEDDDRIDREVTLQMKNRDKNLI